MEIVIAVSGSYGDVRPMVALGKYLKGNGHHVTICASPNNEDFIAGNGLEGKTVGYDWNEHFMKKVEKDKNVLKIAQMMKTFFREEVSLQFTQFPDFKNKPDLMLGAGMQCSIRSIAESLAVPYRQISYMPQALQSGYLPPPGIKYFNLPHSVNRLLWRMSNHNYNSFLLDTINKYRQDLSLKKISDVMSYTTDNLIVAADKPMAAVQPDVTSEYIQTGYLYFSEEGELDHELIKFIENGAPPVYLGFGSMPNYLKEGVPALVRKIVDTLGIRVIVSKGWGNLGVDLDSKNVFTIGYVPFMKLFPKMAAVIHHGGAGTTHLAARAGVPQIIIAHGLDQYYWGERVFRLKLGPQSMSVLTLKPSKLLKKIDETISNPEYRTNAGIFAEKLSGIDGLKDTYHSIGATCLDS
jgi:vancomycin aglycone glucosyltransferase